MSKNNMKCAILAAGRGSRLGSITKTIPKCFLNFNDVSVFENQISIVEEYCDEILLVLGHGFVDAEILNGNISQYDQVVQKKSQDNIYFCSHPQIESNIKIDKIKKLVETPFDIDLKVLVIPYWEEVDNAESCRQAMDFFGDEDLLLLSGDRFLTKKVIQRSLSKFDEGIINEPYHVVSALDHIEENKTAVNWDESGRIVEYGVVKGHPDAGVFVIDKRLLSKSKTILKNNPEKWWPIIFTELPSYVSTVDSNNHHEINVPKDIHNIDNKIPPEE